MNKNSSITIDNYQITAGTVQQAYGLARQQNKEHQVIAETFRMMNLNKLYETNPGDPSVKQAIKAIVDSDFQPRNYEDQHSKPAFDFNQFYPLNKVGNFGRVLTRKCRIVERGIMEFTDDNQESKVKQIKSFANKIESYSQPENDKKIEWLQEQNKYPFRIVLVDRNNGHKGIYFKTFEEAENIRIVLTQRYRYSGNFLSLIATFNKGLLDETTEIVKDKLIARHKMLVKSNRFSRNASLEASPGKQSRMSRVEPNQNSSIFDRERQDRQSSVFGGGLGNSSLQKRSQVQQNQNISNQRVNSCFRQVDDLYMANFFQNWVENAKLKESAINRQIVEPSNVYSRIQHPQNTPSRIQQSENANSRIQQPQSNVYSRTQQPENNYSRLQPPDNTASRLQQPESNSRINYNAGTESVFKSRLESRGNQSSPKQESPLYKQITQSPDNFHLNYIGNSYNSNEFKQPASVSLNQTPIRQLPEGSEQCDQLHFESIQFLTVFSLFFKPIVTIELVRNSKIEQSLVFNTIIKKKQPHLIYGLIKSNEEENLKLIASLREYDIIVKVIDFLINEEVITDKLSMKSKMVLKQNILVCDGNMLKLQFGPISMNPVDNAGEQQAEIQEIREQLRIPALSAAVRDKIDLHWEKQSQYQGYYNQTNLSIYKILSQIEVLPLTWWKDISEDEYQLLHVVYCASKIMGFKMIRSFRHILRAFVLIYPDLQEMTQKLLSFISVFLKVYYFPQHFNRLQKFHKLLGLNQECELISKVNFQMMVIERLVQLECPNLVLKLSRSNLSYAYQMMEYIYQAFSRNFAPCFLVELWNYLLEDLELLQLNSVLLIVSIIKHYEEELLKTKRLVEFARVLESKTITKVQSVRASVQMLKEKYFGEVRGILAEIKNMFNEKPLEVVLSEYYKQQTAIKEKRKTRRMAEKKVTLRKVNKQIDIDFPEYPNQKYTLHIFFRKLPETAGSLTIRCNEVEYECLNHDKNRYFIIGEVAHTLTLAFMDLKACEYSSPLILNQGIHEHTIYLSSSRNSSQHRVSYIGGLLTDNQIEIFKQGKKFDHFLSPFMKESQFREQMHRPLSDAYFLRKYDSNNNRDDLVKKIKVLFCSGSKTFNQIEFYIQQIQTSELTIEQKLSMVKVLANKFSQQFCLCSNQMFQKHFILYFLESTGFSISAKEYECFYTDSLEYEFDAPKIIKCRYYPHHQPHKELKLELEAINYYVNKCHEYLYPDIIIDDLVQAVKPGISKQLGGFFEGELKLYYSSGGEVFLKVWLIRQKGKTKEIYYEEIKEDTPEQLDSKDIGDPEVLMTEVLPSFAKISTILDYVNSRHDVDLKAKYQDKERRKVAENINILKEYQHKFSRIIMMRPLSQPTKLHLPFFNYYYELVHEASTPIVKNIVLNSFKTDLKAVCLFSGQLKFGENPKVESFTYNDELALYGNLRLMDRDAKGWFFFGNIKEDNEMKKHAARVFINYGYGIFRWEPCQVLGFERRLKQNHLSNRSPVRSNSNSSSPLRNPKAQQESNGKMKKFYLIMRKGQQKYVKEYELQFSGDTLQKVQELVVSNPSPYKPRSNISDQDSGRGGLRYLSKFIKG